MKETKNRTVLCGITTLEVTAMKQITSFTINHDYLKPGMYISRVDGDVVTYDMRMKLPNNPAGDYLEDNALHTFEHLFATYVRNTPLSDGVVYVGPMAAAPGSISSHGIPFPAQMPFAWCRRHFNMCWTSPERFPAASTRSAATTLPMIWRAQRQWHGSISPLWRRGHRNS